MLMTGNDYKETLRRYKPRIYIDGDHMDSVADEARLGPDTAGWMSVISLHGGGSPEAMRREIYCYYPLEERRDLIERLLDRGVIDLDDGKKTNNQPGRCCPVGCQVPKTPDLNGSTETKPLPNAAE